MGRTLPMACASDWDRFLALVRYHRLAPQAARALSGLPGVPPRITRALARTARTGAVGELRQAAELARIAAVLNGAGVPLLALKGPVEGLLGRGAFGDRPAVDVDVFVPPDSVGDALRALWQAGWQSVPGYSGHNGHCQLGRENHYGLRRGPDDPRVELHWRLRRIHLEYPLTVKQALAIAEPLTLAGGMVRTLPLAHRVLYLCVHGSHHLWERVSRLLDIGVYLHRGLPPQVGELATGMGLERPLLLAVHLAHRLLDAPVPLWLERARTPGKDVVRLAARAVARWDTTTPPPGGEIARWIRLPYALALHRDRPDRVKALAERLWRRLAPGLVLCPGMTG